jgi:hypothetical protein
MLRLTVYTMVTLSICGCHRGGLSPREQGNTNYTVYLMSLYDNANAGAAGAAASGPQALRLPARVAVAQIGEVAPPQALIDYLRGQADLFARVEGVPDMASGMELYRGQESTEGVRQRVNHEVQRMQRFARDLGMDYLFLYGGNVDYGTRQGGLSVLDLTIVGAYLVPSRKVEAYARASGALVDLGTGRVAIVSSADARDGKLASAVTEDDAEQKVLADLREDVVGKLGEQLVADLRAFRGAGGGGANMMTSVPAGTAVRPTR